MAQEKIGFYGKFQAQAADTSSADRTRALAGLVGQGGDLAYQIGVKQKTKKGVEAGLEEGRLAASEGRAVETKDSTFSVYGQAFDDAAKGSYVSSVGLSSKEKIGQFAIDHADDPDAFAKVSDEHRKGILQNAPPEMQDQINEFISSRIDSVGAKVRSDYADKVIKESNETMDVAISELSAESATLARSGDHVGATASLNQANAMIDQSVKSGGMTSKQGVEKKRLNRVEVAQQRTNFKLDTIAEKEGIKEAYLAIEEMRNDIPKGTTPDEWDSYIASAQTNLGRKSSRLSALKEIESEEAKEAIKQYKSAVALGFEVDPTETARVYGLATTKEQKEELQRIDRVALFSTQSASDRDTIISSKDTGKLIDVADYSAMIAADEELQAEAEKDGYALGVKQGLIEDIPFDATDPESYAMKVEQSKFLSKHFGVSIGPFNDTEASALALSIDGMDSKEKTQLALTLSQSPDVWGQLASKNQAQFAMAGAIGDTDVMQTIFKGQDILDVGNLALKLPRADYLPVFNDLVGDVYGTENKSAMLKSALAYYAATGNQEEFDEDDFTAAIESVSGGIGEINDFKVELPRGVREDDFEDFIDNFSVDYIAAMGGVSGYTPEQAVELIQDGRVKSVGANQYHVINGNTKLMNAKGTPFTLSYTAKVQRDRKAWDVATASKEFSEGRSPTDALRGLAKRGGF